MFFIKPLLSAIKPLKHPSYTWFKQGSSPENKTLHDHRNLQIQVFSVNNIL